MLMEFVIGALRDMLGKVHTAKVAHFAVQSRAISDEGGK